MTKEEILNRINDLVSEYDELQGRLKQIEDQELELAKAQETLKPA